MIYFTGDINLTDNDFDAGYGVGSSLAKGHNVFRHIYKRQSDIWVGNFEGVTSHKSIRSGWNRNCFNILPEYLGNCSNLIDYWSIANNHVMEHGPDAYKEMDSVLTAHSKGCFGSSAHKHIVIETNGGGKFGVISFSLRNDHTNMEPLYWNFPELHDIVEEFEMIKHAHFKIAYIHWGVEYIDHPSWQQKKFGHWLIDLGFDLVIGMHPHVLQGYEIYRGKHIFYSLGNFVFNMAYPPTHYGAIVGVDEEKYEIQIEYVEIKKDYCPHIVSERDVPQKYQFSTLNKKLHFQNNIESYIAEAQSGLKAFQRTNRKNFIRHIYKYDHKVLWGMITDFINRKIYKNNQYDTSNSYDWGG